MHSARPLFFEQVRQTAYRRWNQLKADEGLAGPWYQLFKQLRSQPRHVLSELLQNADDARANWARVSLVDDVFLFEHNGKDFDNSDFESLCSFGVSNKRSLHTIGFRGVGFKTTFSLGQRVQVRTPTLSFSFDEERFTEPVWCEGADHCEHTSIQVQVDSRPKVLWLEKHLEGWTESAIPLLFFQSLEQLEVQGTHISRASVGKGPVRDSEWLALRAHDEQRALLLNSVKARFPREAVREVREERGVSDLTLPPCRVQIVVAKSESSRLYIVLPTPVTLDLPFSVNAPFVQDPARTGIKSPVVSPTNTWLLRRVGEFTASALKAWLANSSLTLAQRAGAYESLLPKSVGATGQSLSAECAAHICEAFQESLHDRRVLLTVDGNLAGRDGCLGLPAELSQVWTAKQNLKLFGQSHEKVVAPEVSVDARNRLESWELLKQLDSASILRRLSRKPYPPRPAGNAKLMVLWALMQSYMSQSPSYYLSYPARDLAVVPVLNQDRLYPATSVTRMGFGGRNLSREDWAFLGGHVPLADPDWFRWLDDDSDSSSSGEVGTRPGEARRLAESLRSGFRQGLGRAIEGAAAAIFSKANPGEGGIKLAYVAARADVVIPDCFRYLCDDGKWRSVTEGLLVDVDAALELLPLDWAETRLLHVRYAQAENARDRQVWRRWAGSTNSRLRRFPLPKKQSRRVRGRSRAEAFVRQRGGLHSVLIPLEEQRLLSGGPRLSYQSLAEGRGVVTVRAGVMGQASIGNLPRLERPVEGMLQGRSQTARPYKPLSCGPWQTCSGLAAASAHHQVPARWARKRTPSRGASPGYRRDCPSSWLRAVLESFLRPARVPRVPGPPWRQEQASKGRSRCGQDSGSGGKPHAAD